MADIINPSFFDRPEALLSDGGVVKYSSSDNKKKDNCSPITKRSDYVREYSSLPMIVICDLVRLGEIKPLPSPESLPREAREMYKKIENRYQNVACWLSYQLLTKDEVETELGIDYQLLEYKLFHTDLITFKEDAEDELLTLNLIKELRPSSLWLQKCDSSEDAWFKIAKSNCWRELANKNILGNGQPFEIGKTEYVREGRKIDRLFKTNMVTRSVSGSPNINWAQNLETLLFDEAARVANDNDYFREKYWNPYCERRQQFWNKVESNQLIQREWITQSGEYFRTGNGKRIPKTKPEGFKSRRSTRGRPIGSRNRK
jgi:hypothetical protein